MKKVFFLVMLCFLLSGCASKEEVLLDENQAISTANAFLQEIMNKNFKLAYDNYMSPGIKFNPNSTLDQFTADWQAIIEKYGSLQKATFDAYQLVPGKRVIQLYYNIVQEKVKKPIVYHLVLEQDRQGKFTIFLIDIGNEKVYPPNATEPAAKIKKEEIIEVIPE